MLLGGLLDDEELGQTRPLLTPTDHRAGWAGPRPPAFLLDLADTPMNFVSLWGGGFGLPETVALAAVAVFGYVFGCRRDTPRNADKPDELIRAAAIARQLEAVLTELRSDLATHRADVERFKLSVDSVDAGVDESHRQLREEAERVLTPTLRLVGKVATAYDQIRQQSQALAGFSGGRTDALTGLCNGKALSELLQLELSGHAATGGQFSVAVLGLHGSAAGTEGRAEQQARLLQAIELLRPQLRDTDLLARYGIDELVVVMPHTRLYGACVFGRRVRTVLGETGLTVSCGLAQSMPDDTATTLLGRADSALYSAKATAAGEQFLHNGQAIRPDKRREAPAEAEAPASGVPQPQEAAAAVS